MQDERKRTKVPHLTSSICTNKKVKNKKPKIKMTDQEFCVVTRKKWLARKSLNKKQPVYRTSSENVLPEVDVPKFLTRLQRVREKMESSDYFQTSLTTLNESLQEFGNTKITKLVCFGIGPFTRSIQALHQFGFILELQKNLQIKDALFFDPVFRESEKEVLKTLECSLMKENCEAKFASDVCTLFYLPHCPNSLTNNLLWKNWLPDKLSQVVLINNSFESLTSSFPDSVLRKDSGYILDVKPFVKEYSLDDCYEVHNIFNDLSVHVFPRSILPEESSEFWTVKEAPKYEKGEMVTTIEFDKLAIS
ncbi:SRR1-like protein [Episyrphus balteatus]|uniref:SRR1-like protein n=1 Tax=Episyrphus balteatus TaxID=286459 RepID=UPI0024860FE6|nr:SRR1-like protein [Episyrphus balteatus]